MTPRNKMNGAIRVVLFLYTITTTQSYTNGNPPKAAAATGVRSSGGSASSSSHQFPTATSGSFVRAETVIVGVPGSPLYSSPTDYFGEPEIRSSFVIKEFSNQEDLKEIIKLASNALPSRPDGIVTVAKYTSATREPCIATEHQYETLARDNPSSLFLRCFSEYKDADILLSAAKVPLTALPIYDVFYGGVRVARVEENNIAGVEAALNNYQFLNSDLDLFSEKAEESFEDTYGDWVPNINDEWGVEVFVWYVVDEHMCKAGMEL